MSKLVEAEKVFPKTYSQLIAVGEKTGNLEENVYFYIKLL